jgi:primosomal protein N' (replication factor Y)
VLLHGVTGSGKTEVYLRAMAAALGEGRGAIVLVPEIALTPQLVARFRREFAEDLVLLHSGLSAGERYDGWERLRRGEARLCVGARSGVFAPVRDLGLIVVDEEHEAAYKQEQSPRYDARTVAQRRAAEAGATLVLGSATPSLEAYYAATEAGTAALVELPERIDQRPLPEVEIIDLRRSAGEENPERDGEDRDWPFSSSLEEKIEACLAAGEQVIILLNRRGFSPFVLCRECGASLRCPDCDVSLTFHLRSKQMRCHHCEYARPVPEVCDRCQGTDMGFLGTGTEKLEDQVRRRFSAARPLRLDSDVTGAKGAHGRILEEFASGRSNVLVGTQMVAKGLDFPEVTLVGIISADTGLNFPDFRAAERTFQLITQAAGRAGRGAKPGRVVVQTFNPDHYSILAASEHNYTAFSRDELDSRRALGYPPFAALVRLVVADRSARRAEALAGKIAALGTAAAPAIAADVAVLGPAPAPLERLRGRYRWQVLVKAACADEARATWDEVRAQLAPRDLAAVTVDVDPQNMM